MEFKYYVGAIRPKDNVIFVFGSNPLGINGNPQRRTGGAALVANLQFGVEQGEKMDNCMSKSGKAYGMVTVTAPGRKRSLSREELLKNILKLYTVARENSDKLFCIAYKNWDEVSLNGYSGSELCGLFLEAAYASNLPENIVFSKEWVDRIPLGSIKVEAINFIV